MKISFNIHSLRFRLSLSAGMLLASLGGALILYAGTVVRHEAADKARIRMRAVTLTEAQGIKMRFETAMDAARTLAQSIAAVQSSGRSLTRDQVNAMLRQVLVGNPEFLGTYTCWEPDAFDGQDSRYAGSKGHDGTGRFIPYWNRDSAGAIFLDPIIGYESPGIGNFYLSPKKTGRECILEPFTYPVQAENIYMTSLVVPVLVGGRFCGIVGVDYRLAFLQQLADSVKVYGGEGKLFLVTADGTIAAAAGRSGLVGSRIAGIPDLADLCQKISFSDERITSLAGNLFSSAPVVVGKSDTPWAVVLQVPEQVVMADALRRIKVMLLAAFLFTSLGIGLSIFLISRLFLRKVIILSASAKEFAAGNFEVRCNLPGKDELSQLADSFNAMVAQVDQSMMLMQANHAMMSAVFDSTSDLIWTVDAQDFRLLTFNRGLEEHFIKNYGRQVVRGNSLEDLFSTKEYIGMWRGMYEQTLREGSYFTDYQSMNRDTTLGLSLNVVKNDSGVFAISVFGHNVTEQKRAEEALSASEKKYRLIVENAPLGIFRRVFDGPYEYANPEFLRQFGFSSFEDFIPHYDDQAFRRLPLQSHKEFLRLLLEHRKVLGYESDLNFPDGSKRSISLFAFLDDDSKSVTGFSIDITQRKVAESERERLMDQIHQSQRLDAIGQLAGGVAHDFNNMLAGIAGAAELLAVSSLPYEKRLTYVNMISKAVSRAADLTGKLLAFSRKGSKASTVIDVARIVQDSVALLRRTIDKRIVITFENGAAPSTVVGDDAMLQNVFLNMGINASHAMPDGGTLSFRIWNADLDESYCNSGPYKIAPGRFVEIEISDTGCGMTSEIQSRIFEPFFTTKEQGKGTGLGLAAAYGAIQDHHGAISVYSEVGIGTVFHVYLPLSSDAVPAAAAEEPSLSGSGFVLLVDDDEIIRVTAKDMLESLGYSVTLAENGKDGVDIFRTRHDEIDVVILDMVMPVMGGRDAFASMISIDSSVKVILSSGFTREDDLAEMRKQGLFGLIRKPFRKAELSRIVADALSCNHKKGVE